MTQPALSVIIPSFNRSDVLRRAVASVLHQTSADFELVVVDDGSTDDTPEMLAVIDDHRIRTITQLNAGVCAARNAGADASSGSFIVFLDSDDEAAPGWVEFYLAAANDSVEFAACGVRAVESDGQQTILAAPNHGIEFGFLPARFLAGAFGLTKELFVEIGGFRPGLRFSEHTDFALRIGGRMLESPFTCRRTDEPLMVMHRGERTYDPQVRYDSAITILTADSAHLERSPHLHATYAAIAGVAASKLGHRSEARRLLARAVRVNPRALRNSLRLGRELLPRRRSARAGLRDTTRDT